MSTISPCLWFDTEAEDAARYYTSDFTFSEAISFEIACADQAEVDRYWTTLSEGGEEGPCGWLKDRFGVSWQVVPRRLNELAADPDAEKAQRVIAAMLKMAKIDVAELERAAAAS